MIRSAYELQQARTFLSVGALPRALPCAAPSPLRSLPRSNQEVPLFFPPDPSQSAAAGPGSEPGLLWGLAVFSRSRYSTLRGRLLSAGTTCCSGTGTYSRGVTQSTVSDARSQG
jgi:hypothetical protein